MIEVDNNQNVLFVSKGFERISGYTEAELKGKHAPSILLDDEKQKQINSDQRKNRLKGKEGFYEIIIKSKHMGHRNWIVSGTPIYDKNGKIKGSIGIHWDITETKKFESKLLLEKIQKERQLIEERLKAEEKQRASISRDLHDGIGQSLVYLGLYVKLLKEKARVNKKDLEKAEKTI